MLSDWLRDPAKRTSLCAHVLLVTASAWGVFRIARSMQLLFSVSHDSFMYYSLWFVMAHRDMADIALRQSFYLPHTWVFLTPFFCLGWPLARILLLMVNVVALGFIWVRLSRLAELEGVRRWLLLAFFCSWLGTGLVLGLGNLALVCIAAVLAAYPFSSRSSQVVLAFSAMKQTLVFPVFFHLLLRRPKVLVLPCAIFGVCGVAALIWARLSIPEAFKMAAGAVSAVGTWTQFDHLCLRRVLGLVVHNAGMLAAANWLVWLALFVPAMRMRDPLCQLAAFLLLGLLPIYHNVYDMVAAVPALAIFLRRGNIIGATLMTVLLATNIMAPLARFAPGPLRSIAAGLESGYYPGAILLFLAGLFLIDHRGGKAAAPALAQNPELTRV
jgi:hypothetical protein